MKRNLIVLTFVAGLLLLVTTVLSQSNQPIPLPATAGRAEVLVNAGFETDADADKIPDGWTPKNITVIKADKRKCDNGEFLYAHSGACAFMFRSNPAGDASKLIYNVPDVSTFVTGSEVVFSVYLDPRSGVAGSKIGKVTIFYSDSTFDKLTLSIPLPLRGVEDYVQLQDSLVLPTKTVTAVKVMFLYNRTTGKFFIDDASLTVPNVPEQTATAGGPTLTATDTPLPATETPLPTDTPPATSTPDPTATETSTELPTVTATETSTELPTSTPTSTPLP